MTMKTSVLLSDNQQSALRYITKCIRPNIGFYRTALKFLGELVEEDRDILLTVMGDDVLKNWIGRLNPDDRLRFIKLSFAQETRVRLVNLGLLHMEDKWGEFYLSRAHKDPDFKNALDRFTEGLPSKIRNRLVELERLYPTIAAFSH